MFLTNTSILDLDNVIVEKVWGTAYIMRYSKTSFSSVILNPFMELGVILMGHPIFGVCITQTFFTIHLYFRPRKYLIILSTKISLLSPINLLRILFEISTPMLDNEIFFSVNFSCNFLISSSLNLSF